MCKPYRHTMITIFSFIVALTISQSDQYLRKVIIIKSQSSHNLDLTANIDKLSEHN